MTLVGFLHYAGPKGRVSELGGQEMNERFYELAAGRPRYLIKMECLPIRALRNFIRRVYHQKL